MIFQFLSEGLARQEMFLFTANLFNQFKISSGKIPPDSTRTNFLFKFIRFLFLGKLGGTATPNHFYAVPERRYV